MCHVSLIRKNLYKEKARRSVLHLLGRTKGAYAILNQGQGQPKYNFHPRVLTRTVLTLCREWRFKIAKENLVRVRMNVEVEKHFAVENPTNSLQCDMTSPPFAKTTLKPQNLTETTPTVVLTGWGGVNKGQSRTWFQKLRRQHLLSNKGIVLARGGLGVVLRLIVCWWNGAS